VTADNRWPLWDAGLRTLAMFTDTAGHAVVAAELDAVGSAPPPLPDRLVIVLPGGYAAYVSDPAAFIAWAGERLPDLLAGASLGREVARALAEQQPVDGLTHTYRSGGLLAQLPAATAIEGQRR
jgi:hypothetical protein